MYKIQNRKYIGSKSKLIGFIVKMLYLENIQFNTFSDLFAGTEIFSKYFLSKNKKVYINDSLYSNNDRYNQAKIYKLLNYYNNSENYTKDNYFSDTFSGTYFSYSNAKFICSVREHSDYCKSKALNSLTDLLSKLKTKYIALAYNK